MKKKIFFYITLIVLAGNVYCQEQMDNIKSIILSSEAGISNSRNRDITFLEKINMGISGGDNWLVEWTRRNEDRNSIIFVYIINDDKVIAEFNMQLNFNVSKYTDFDIMKDIPGTRINKGSTVIYDYNNDGFDEIFSYVFGGNWCSVFIAGYDPDRKSKGSRYCVEDMASYAEIPFDIVDREKGPAPVEFISYKGMEGFKVYYYQIEVAGGPGWVPEPAPKNKKWFFYTWNEERRQYVEVEEVDPKYEEQWEFVEVDPKYIDGYAHEPVQEIAVVTMENEPSEEMETSTKEAIGQDSKFNRTLIIIIGGIVVLLAAVAVLFVLRRKVKA